MPLLILLVALAVVVWGTQRNEQREEEVQQHARQLCEAAAAGRDLTGRVNPVDPFTERQTIEQIRRVCPDADALAALEIIVTAGDAAHIGRVHDPATHTAVLRIDGVDQLGLRLEHPGDPQHIRVIGYWLPPGQ